MYNKERIIRNLNRREFIVFECMTPKNELKCMISSLEKVRGNIYIQMHNHPDPDSLASGFGLQYLLKEKGIQSTLCYYGELNKSNLLKMIEIFSIHVIHIDDIKNLNEEDCVILVDCQRGEGNVYPLPIQTVYCIDHHTDLQREYEFSDIRSELGACSTIITEYFLENNIAIPNPIAGALLYGINIDTNNLTRGVSSLDVDVFYKLMNQINPQDIIKLNHSQIAMSDLKYYSEGLANVEKYDTIGFAHIRDCNDALLGTIGDIVLSVNEISVSVIYSVREDGIKFSVRSSDEEIHANRLIEHVLAGIGSGGGHKEMAGGFVAKDHLTLLGDRKLSTYIKYRTIGFIDKMQELQAAFQII